MKQFEVEIETLDASLTLDIFPPPRIAAGVSRLTLADGSTITYQGTRMSRALDSSAVIGLSISLAGAVATGFISNWLYDLSKVGKIKKIRINRQEIEITPEKLRIVIEEIERED